MPEHWAGIKEIYPDRFNRLVQLEKELNFTIDNSKDLLTYVGNTPSCVPANIKPNLMKILQTGIVPNDYVSVADYDKWELPCGAFKGSSGGPC